MANVFFTLKLTWASVTNDIRVSVYNVLDQTTPIASVQHNAPHLDQQYDFPGLPRTNFIYKVLETEINGTTVLGQLGQATFVPANDELTQKPPVLIEVGVSFIPGTTTVWPAGVNTVTVSDWIGQAFAIYGRPGQFPIKDDGILHVDSEFDSTTGDLTLFQDGDVFQDREYWYFSFLPVISQSSGGIGGGTTVGGGGFSDIKLVTANTTLVAADIGKKILIAPAGNFITITLPSLTDAEANRITFFEMVNSAAKCCQVVAASGDTLAWIDTEIDICPNETFELYKRIVSAGVFEWRLNDGIAGYSEVGSFVAIDGIITNGNYILADGAALNYQQYYRLYRRRGVTGISFASWNSGNAFTYMKFSQKDTAGSTFHVPDFATTPVYLRSGGGSDFVPQKMLAHQHIETLGTLTDSVVSVFGKETIQRIIGTYELGGSGPDAHSRYAHLTSRSVAFNSATGLYEIIDGSENNPNSRNTKLYIKT